MAVLVADPTLAAAREGLDADAAWVAEFLPLALPFGWRVLERGGDGCAYLHRSGMTVISSSADGGDGRRWLHVSCARPDRLPSYLDQAEVKRLFVGAEREAYSVWPRKSRHINIHNFCLHLWCPVDGPILPDFTHGGNTI